MGPTSGPSRGGVGADNKQRASSSRYPRKEFTKNNAGNERRGEREWRSGEVFSQRPRQRKNDPWWMREDEMNNPRILPPYQPWWLEATPARPDAENPASGNILVNNSWKLIDLKAEAQRRGLRPETKKELLIAQLLESSRLHDLSDAGFVTVRVIRSSSISSSLPCFPEAYETPENFASLKLEVSQLNPSAVATDKRKQNDGKK